MAEFDEKLNSLLSNPDAMSQIMQLAQSLGAGQETASVPPQAPPKQSIPTPVPAPQAGSGPFGKGDLLSSLTSGVDPAMLFKLMPLIQELGGQQNSNARNLLYALRPYLKEERQNKIERALQIARLFHVGKKFLSEWEG